MRTSHLVIFCSSKLIFMPDGVSFMHSAYSCCRISLLSITGSVRHAYLQNALLGTGTHCGSCDFVVFSMVVEAKVGDEERMRHGAAVKQRCEMKVKAESR